MKKTRVPYGEKFWFIRTDGRINYGLEYEDLYCKDFFDCGNYFATKEEAEQAARKIRAVFAGADVIEMPSEEEIKKSVDYIASECVAEPTGWIEELQRPELSFKDLKDAIVEGINLLKSKIVK